MRATRVAPGAMARIAATPWDAVDELSSTEQGLDPVTLLAQLGRNGRARVEREFTTENMVRNTLRVYEKVLA